MKGHEGTLWKEMHLHGGRHTRTVGVAPSLITLTNDYANHMIKLTIITNIS
jgi:hypothetical protein